MVKTRNLTRRTSRAGIALIIVMLVIGTLAALVSVFAYNMKVEAALARNANSQLQLEWTARSLAEGAAALLAKTAQTTRWQQEGDMVNQIWAGRDLAEFVDDNEPLLALMEATGLPLPAEFNARDPLPPLTPVKDFRGAMVDYRIEPMAARYNINVAQREYLLQALFVMQADEADADLIADSILDWIDPDDATHLAGTESEFYERLDPPYVAKNGLIDDMTELLLVRGIRENPELFYGPAQMSQQGMPFGGLSAEELNPPIPVAYGLNDLFTAISSVTIHLNAARSEALQVIPGMTPEWAEQIADYRVGFDQVEGTEDDQPGDIGRMGVAIPPDVLTGLQQAGATNRGAIFRVTMKIALHEHEGTWVAILRRGSPTDVQVLTFYRES